MLILIKNYEINYFVGLLIDCRYVNECFNSIDFYEIFFIAKATFKILRLQNKN